MKELTSFFQKMKDMDGSLTRLPGGGASFSAAADADEAGADAERSVGSNGGRSTAQRSSKRRKRGSSAKGDWKSEL